MFINLFYLFFRYLHKAKDCGGGALGSGRRRASENSRAELLFTGREGRIQRYSSTQPSTPCSPTSGDPAQWCWRHKRTGLPLTPGLFPRLPLPEEQPSPHTRAFPQATSAFQAWSTPSEGVTPPAGYTVSQARAPLSLNRQGGTSIFLQNNRNKSTLPSVLWPLFQLALFCIGTYELLLQDLLSS